MRRLYLDFETRSLLDPRKVGMARYAKHAEVLMLAWAIDDGPVRLAIWEEKDRHLRGRNFLMMLCAYDQPELAHALTSPGYQKVAWKCRFEKTILKDCLDIDVPAEQWLDPAVIARYASLPWKLLEVSKVLGLGDKSKDKEGSKLIRKFSMPRPKRKGKPVSFLQPEDAPEDWLKFQAYCRQDVIAEREILHKLEKRFSLTPFEQKIFVLDQIINERGAPVDMEFVDAASKLVTQEKARLMAELRGKTGLANPNSGAQMLPWLQERGYPFTSLLKKRVDLALADTVQPLTDEVRKVLEMRAMLSRSSTSKLDAIRERVVDGRLKYSYQFYGAARTGRWSGEGVQTQNLPR